MLPRPWIFLALGLVQPSAGDYRSWADALPAPDWDRLAAELGTPPPLDVMIADGESGPRARTDEDSLPADLEALRARLDDALDLARGGDVAAGLELAWSHAREAGVDRAGVDPFEVHALAVLARVESLGGNHALASRIAGHALALLPRREERFDDPSGDLLYVLWRSDFKRSDPARARTWIHAALSRRLASHGPDPTACGYLACAGNCAYALGELALSERAFRTVRRWRSEHAGRRPEEARELQALGALLMTRGALAEARTYLDEALQVGVDTLGAGHADSARIRSTLARLLERLGEYSAAVRTGEEAVEALARTRGDAHAGTDRARLNLARTLLLGGEFSRAESFVTPVLDRVGEGNERLANRADALEAIATVLLAKGEGDAALECARSSVQVAESFVARPHPTLIRIGTTLGLALREAGEYAEALEVLDRCDEDARALYGARSLWSLTARADRVELLAQHGDPETAVRESRALLELIGGADEPELRSRAHYALATGLLAVEEYAAAEAEARAAAELLARRESPHALRLFGALSARARALEMQGELREAAEIRARILEMHATTRAHLTGDPHHRAHAGGFHSWTGAILARLRVQLGEHELAFEAAEEGRGRVLLDLLQQVRAGDGTDSPALEEEAARRDQLAREMFRWDALRRRPDLGDDRAEALLDQERRVRAAREAARAAGSRVLEDLGRSWPDVRPRPLAELRAALEPGDCVLGYTWARSGVTLVVLPGPTGDALGIVLAAESEVAALEQRVRDLRERLARPLVNDAEAEELTELRARLGDDLIPAAVRPVLADARRVVVLPQGPLIDLPLDLVGMAGDESLFDRVEEVVVSPSASVYCDRTELATTRSDDALLFGAVRTGRLPSIGSAGGPAQDTGVALPGAGEELARIRETLERCGLSPRVVSGSGATQAALERAVLAEVPRVLHIATHGYAGAPGRPYEAGLALASNGPAAQRRFTLADLLRGWHGRLRGCDLVVLSACETQTSTSVGASDLSLAWGFFHAGARSVLGSLWRVDDDSTALLMSRFYENLYGAHDDVRSVGARAFGGGEPMTKGIALSEAKRWLRTVERSELRRLERRQRGGPGTTESEVRPYTDPYFWAGFVLVGAAD